MDRNLTEVVELIFSRGLNEEILDKVAEIFKVDAVYIVVLKDFNITFSLGSSFLKNKGIDLIKLYRQSQYKNHYFEKAIKVGYAIENNYQNSRYTNPLWKGIGVKSVLLYKLDTEFNAVIGFETFKNKKSFGKQDLERIKSLTPVISTVLENVVYKEFLSKSLPHLDVELPEKLDKKLIRRWIRLNLEKILQLTKAKAVIFVCRKHGIYSLASYNKDINFVKFKMDKNVKNLLAYRVYEENIRGPAVWVCGLSKGIPESISDKLGIANVLVVPVWEKGKLTGVLGYGYASDLHFSVYDVNVVSLLTKRLFQILDMYKRYSHLKSILTESENEIINSFVMALEARDTYTKGHSQRVAYYAKRIAQSLGLNKVFVDKVYVAGLLHDLGKIGIPDAVLMKPGKLSHIEYEMIKYHPVLSYEIVSQLKSLKDLKTIAKMVRHHHERCDGKGYPDGLKCKDISKGARILAIADVFDALTTSRPYRPAFSVEEAINIMRKDKGHFDMELFNKSVDVLVDSFEFASSIVETSLIPKAFDKYKRKFANIYSLTGLLKRDIF